MNSQKWTTIKTQNPNHTTNRLILTYNDTIHQRNHQVATSTEQTIKTDNGNLKKINKIIQQGN